MMDYMTSEVYATALFRLAEEKNKVGVVAEQFQMIADVFRSNRTYYLLFLNPKIQKQEKKSLLKEWLQNETDHDLLNFLYVLLDKNRMNYILEVAGHFSNIVRKKKDQTEGVLVSAVSMDEETLAEAERKVSKLVRKTVKLRNKVDPSIIGGMSIYIDGQVIDASIKNRLEAIYNGLVKR